MGDAKPTVVVTGISGNLGSRLLPQLGGFNVIGVDGTPPVTDLPLRFERMDLGEEESCRQLFFLLRETRRRRSSTWHSSWTRCKLECLIWIACGRLTWLERRG
jgi:nucleoside-diphosphate-sugar epimerase